ncbi:MAG: hypothetical protein NVSMB32_05320 [Actinomycetota bacterium]
MIGMIAYGDGYLMVGRDGGIFDFSNKPFAGSLGGAPPASPVVSVAAPGRALGTPCAQRARQAVETGTTSLF